MANTSTTQRLKITLGKTVLTATLNDSPTTQDFISLLPLTLTLKDYAGTEKISDLPKRLSTNGAPNGSKPLVGAVAYYAPWGNLALFYKAFSFSDGLILLGRIETGIEALQTAGSIEAKLEIVQ